MHKLVNTEIWSLTWAKDGQALFRFGEEITVREIHIICEAIPGRARMAAQLEANVHLETNV